MLNPPNPNPGAVGGNVEKRPDAQMEEGVSDEERYSEMSTDSESFQYDPFMMLPHHRSYPPFTQFNTAEAEKIIKEVLKDALTGVSYHFETFSELTVQLSTRIKDQIKAEMYLPRYKLVASVTIAQLSSPEQGAGIGTCSKPLWNENTDSCAQASFMSSHLYATGVVYAAYYY